MVTEISLISVRSEIPFLDPAERILLLSSIFKTGLIRLSSNNLDALQTISDTELIHTVMKSKETFIKKNQKPSKTQFPHPSKVHSWFSPFCLISFLHIIPHAFL